MTIQTSPTLLVGTPTAAVPIRIEAETKVTATGRVLVVASLFWDACTTEEDWEFFWVYAQNFAQYFGMAGWRILSGNLDQFKAALPGFDKVKGGVQVIAQSPLPSAKAYYEATHSGSLTGKQVVLTDGRTVTVERHNGYVLSGFDFGSHSWWAVDLRNEDASVLGR